MDVNSLLLSLALVSSAFAQSEREDWADRIFEADADSNRRVTLDEAKAAFDEMTNATFAMLDRDKNGFVQDSDFGAVAVDPVVVRDSIAKAMESDRNGDGRVAYGEITVSRPGYPKRNFDRIDLDEDGYVTQDDVDKLEARSPRKPARAMDDPEARTQRVAKLYRALLDADSNGDGAVSFDEAHAGMPNLTRAVFDRLDRDGDGAVSKKDRRAARTPKP